MDLKKVDELVRMRNNCGAATDVLIIELLSVIANNTSRLVQIEENKISDQQELPFGNTNPPKVYAKDVLQTNNGPTPEEVKAEIAKEKEEQKAKKEVEVPNAKLNYNLNKKKAAPKKVEEPKQEVVKEEPKVETQEELPTRDEVMSKLVEFIQDNGEEALANIFKELGGYANFPAVPQEKYPELLNKIA